jgi:hypothetical protein
MRTTFRILATLSIAWLASPPAHADDDDCLKVNSSIVTTFFVIGCTSPFGLCTAGTVSGRRFSGTTLFVATSVAPVSDATPWILAYTGVLTITTRRGVVTIHDSGIFDAMKATFFELDTVVSGTGAFTDATGLLTSQGTASTTGFSGTLTGSICSIDDHESKNDHESKDEAEDRG